MKLLFCLLLLVSDSLSVGNPEDKSKPIETNANLHPHPQTDLHVNDNQLDNPLPEDLFYLYQDISSDHDSDWFKEIDDLPSQTLQGTLESIDDKQEESNKIQEPSKEVQEPLINSIMDEEVGDVPFNEMMSMGFDDFMNKFSTSDTFQANLGSIDDKQKESNEVQEPSKEDQINSDPDSQADVKSPGNEEDNLNRESMLESPFSILDKLYYIVIACTANAKKETKEWNGITKYLNTLMSDPKKQYLELGLQDRRMIMINDQVIEVYRLMEESLKMIAKGIELILNYRNSNNHVALNSIKNDFNDSLEFYDEVLTSILQINQSINNCNSNTDLILIQSDINKINDRMNKKSMHTIMSKIQDRIRKIKSYIKHKKQPKEKLIEDNINDQEITVPFLKQLRYIIKKINTDKLQEILEKYYNIFDSPSDGTNFESFALSIANYMSDNNNLGLINQGIGLITQNANLHENNKIKNRLDSIQKDFLTYFKFYDDIFRSVSQINQSIQNHSETGLTSIHSHMNKLMIDLINNRLMGEFISKILRKFDEIIRHDKKREEKPPKDNENDQEKTNLFFDKFKDIIKKITNNNWRYNSYLIKQGIDLLSLKINSHENNKMNIPLNSVKEDLSKWLQYIQDILTIDSQMNQVIQNDSDLYSNLSEITRTTINHLKDLLTEEKTLRKIKYIIEVHNIEKKRKMTDTSEAATSASKIQRKT